MTTVYGPPHRRLASHRAEMEAKWDRENKKAHSGNINESRIQRNIHAQKRLRRVMRHGLDAESSNDSDDQHLRIILAPCPEAEARQQGSYSRERVYFDSLNPLPRAGPAHEINRPATSSPLATIVTTTDEIEAAPAINTRSETRVDKLRRGSLERTKSRWLRALLRGRTRVYISTKYCKTSGGDLKQRTNRRSKHVPWWEPSSGPPASLGFRSKKDCPAGVVATTLREYVIKQCVKLREKKEEEERKQAEAQGRGQTSNDRVDGNV